MSAAIWVIVGVVILRALWLWQRAQHEREAERYRRRRRLLSEIRRHPANGPQ